MWRDAERSPLGSFRREIDRLFDDMFRSPVLGFGGGLGTGGWPQIEVKETDRELLVTAEVPGMNEKDVELLLDNGTLTLRGERKEEKDERGYSERWYGRFERRIPLPQYIDENGCSAEFRDGLLRVTLPKSPEAQNAKRIPINGQTRH
jgi:HSP20 family protein